MAGANKIIAIDVNPDKFAIAEQLGATHCIDASTTPDVKGAIVGDLTDWGVDYSFDCTGKVDVMRTALESCHRGWGTSCIIGKEERHEVGVLKRVCTVGLFSYALVCIVFFFSLCLGVAASGHEISTRPFQLVTGRVWKGTAFGGFKSRTDVPMLVERNLNGTLPIDHFITHTFNGVANTNEAIDALHSGSCLRAVVEY